VRIVTSGGGAKSLLGASHHWAGVAFAWHPCRWWAPIRLIKWLGNIICISNAGRKSISLQTGWEISYICRRKYRYPSSACVKRSLKF